MFLSLWAYIDSFDQFEQQTGGENCNREDASATQKRGNSPPAVDAKAESNKETSSATKEEDDDKEALTDFFDEFEKIINSRLQITFLNVGAPENPQIRRN